MFGFLQKLGSGLKKTSDNLTKGITEVFTTKKIDEETLQGLEDLLLMADVGVGTAADLTDELRQAKLGKEAGEEEIRLFLKDKIAEKLLPVVGKLEIDVLKKPFVILFAGVNGSGKTTTIGKLAKQMTDSGLQVSVAAGDTFRAAAVEQLQGWADRAKCKVFAKETGADAAGVIFDAYNESIKNQDDVLLIDTAGRLQNKVSLMAELEKIIRVIKKIDNTAPHARIVVLDAGVGQNALSQMQEFGKIIDTTGIILTKLDGTAKGGIILALAQSGKIPVQYIGVGEGAEDLLPFDAKEYANILMGVKT